MDCVTAPWTARMKASFASGGLSKPPTSSSTSTTRPTWGLLASLERETPIHGRFDNLGLEEERPGRGSSCTTTSCAPSVDIVSKVLDVQEKRSWRKSIGRTWCAAS